MIKYLKGNIKNISDECIILELNNIGYEINFLNGNYIYDQEVKVYIYESIKENEYSLYGFPTQDELKLFKQFKNIKGLGVKRSYYIVRMFNIEDITLAIRTEDINFFLNIPKVGKKMAENIIENISVLENNQMMNFELKEILKNMGYKEKVINEYLQENKISAVNEENITNFVVWLNKKNDA